MMTVSPRSAGYCCKFCSNEYGYSPNGKAKDRLRRRVKRRDRQAWHKEVSESA